MNETLSTAPPHPGPLPLGEGVASVDCAALSRVFRAALLAYELRPNEFVLAQLLCKESFDDGRLVGRVRREAWAAQLGLGDSKGLRPDKCTAVLKTLNALGIVDVNRAQGTFELRPDGEGWSRARGTRARAFCEPDPVAELGLRDRRELPEMLSQLSRERAREATSNLPLAGGQVVNKPAAAGEQAASEKSAEVVGEIRRSSSEKSADAKNARPLGPNAPSDKSAGPARARTFKRLTFCTENVKRLNVVSSDKSADREAASVCAAVRAFVGEADFERWWARANYVWSDAERVASLAGTLNYVRAGVASGEMLVKTTRGAALWCQAQIDWRKLTYDCPTETNRIT